jgi:hypothetical protein
VWQRSDSELKRENSGAGDRSDGSRANVTSRRRWWWSCELECVVTVVVSLWCWCYSCVDCAIHQTPLFDRTCTAYETRVVGSCHSCTSRQRRERRNDVGLSDGRRPRNARQRRHSTSGHRRRCTSLRAVADEHWFACWLDRARWSCAGVLDRSRCASRLLFTFEFGQL